MCGHSKELRPQDALVVKRLGKLAIRSMFLCRDVVDRVSFKINRELSSMVLYVYDLCEEADPEWREKYGDDMAIQSKFWDRQDCDISILTDSKVNRRKQQILVANDVQTLKDCAQFSYCSGSHQSSIRQSIHSIISEDLSSENTPSIGQMVDGRKKIGITRGFHSQKGFSGYYPENCYLKSGCFKDHLDKQRISSEDIDSKNNESLDINYKTQNQEVVSESVQPGLNFEPVVKKGDKNKRRSFLNWSSAKLKLGLKHEDSKEVDGSQLRDELKVSASLESSEANQNGGDGSIYESASNAFDTFEKSDDEDESPISYSQNQEIIEKGEINHQQTDSPELYETDTQMNAHNDDDNDNNDDDDGSKPSEDLNDTDNSQSYIETIKSSEPHRVPSSSLSVASLLEATQGDTSEELEIRNKVASAEYESNTLDEDSSAEEDAANSAEADGTNHLSSSEYQCSDTSGELNKEPRNELHQGRLGKPLYKLRGIFKHEQQTDI